MQRQLHPAHPQWRRRRCCAERLLMMRVREQCRLQTLRRAARRSECKTASPWANQGWKCHQWGSVPGPGGTAPATGAVICPVPKRRRRITRPTGGWWMPASISSTHPRCMALASQRSLSAISCAAAAAAPRSRPSLRPCPGASHRAPWSMPARSRWAVSASTRSRCTRSTAGIHHQRLLQ